MSQARTARTDDEMRPEYDFTGAVRGKYYKRYTAGTNIVLLDADVSQAFPNSTAVNEALRLLVAVARRRVGAPARRTTRRSKRMKRVARP
jgi:hypothetical protein